MKAPVIIIGIGEMGGVFARGFLRSGYPVYPVTREFDLQQVASEVREPASVLIAVAEKALPEILQQIPEAWANKLCLLQNELLPNDWEWMEQPPTVISVWFEKKQGMDTKVIIPSPVYGPQAELLAEALAALNIPSRILHNPDELLFELVVKNLYILTSNIAGLITGGSVGELWKNHNVFTLEVAEEIITLQEALTEAYFDHEKLIEAMVSAFNGDPDHQCMGRSAPARLDRALKYAKQYNLKLDTLQTIASETTAT